MEINKYVKAWLIMMCGFVLAILPATTPTMGFLEGIIFSLAAMLIMDIPETE